MQKNNLWAPWRINYVQNLDKESDCFLCDCVNNPLDDQKNFVLWRTEKNIVVMNRYPYNNGHFLISPIRHIATFDKADEKELLEFNKLIREIQKALSLAIKPHGFNVGMNFGRCAGAGLPGHLHIHIVPRWQGDTNFINVCSQTDVISQSLAELYELLKNVSEKHNLPNL